MTFRMQLMIAAVMILAGLSPRSATADTVVELTVQPGPTHTAYYNGPKDNDTDVEDIWSLTGPDLPALNGLTGNFTFRILTPVGYRLQTTLGTNLSMSLSWSTTNSYSTAGRVVTAATMSWIDLADTPPSAPLGSSVDFYSPATGPASALGHVSVNLLSSPLSAGGSFAGLDLTFLIDDAAAAFPTTAPLHDPSPSFRLVFSSAVTGDQSGSSTFTSLVPVAVPEPASMSLLAIGGLSLIARRRRRG